MYYPIIRSDLVEYKNYGDHARLKVKFLQMNVNLNSTANLIYMLCLKKLSITEIVKELENKFSGQADKLQIEKDVNSILESFYENGFLDWKDNNPYENEIYNNRSFKIIKRWANNEQSLTPNKIEYLSPYIKKISFENAPLLKSSILAGSLKLYEIKDSLNNFIASLYFNLDKSKNIIILNCISVEHYELLSTHFKIILTEIGKDLDKEFNKNLKHEYIVLAYATEKNNKSFLYNAGFKNTGCIQDDFIECVDVLKYVW